MKSIKIDPMFSREVERVLISNLQHFHYPCMLVETTGRIIGCNRHFTSLSGYREEEITDTNVFQTILQDAEAIEQLLRQESGSIHVKWLHADQGVRAHPIQAILIPDRQTDYAYLQWTNDDGDAPLLQPFSDQLFTRSHLGIILCDPAGKVIRISSTAANILGGEVEQFLQRNIFQWFNTLPEECQLIQRRFFNGLSIRNKVMSWNNGEMEYELLIDSFPIYDQHEQMIGTSIFMKDVTNLRSMENQLRRNDRLAMIGQIAAGTAHEIRNPLTSVKGFLQMIRQRLGEYQLEKEISYTEIMLEEIERINQLVGELLLLSRSREIVNEKISLCEVMEQFLPIIRNEAILKGIDVEYEEFPHLPSVIGNKELLKQVFLNICKNGIEAMGSKGVLSISFQDLPQEQMVSINIADNGPGVPPYVLDKIFDPFFTTKEDGTGLGLSICQRIVHDMGGRILVSSKGFGTTFHVQIPYVSE